VPPARSPAPPARAPSAELLEFLGEFADDREGFVDPLELDDANHAEGAAPEPPR
jgi:hypothetical protein